MAYVHVGFCADLEELREKAEMFAVEIQPAGYGHTQEGVLDAFSDMRDLFPTAQSAMLTVLKPWGVLPLHNDRFEHQERYHVVLKTNPDAWCFHGGEWQQLEEGGIYRMDPTVKHAAVNWNNERRIHLVVDC